MFCASMSIMITIIFTEDEDEDSQTDDTMAVYALCLHEYRSN
jgi:hypothetical protein